MAENTRQGTTGQAIRKKMEAADVIPEEPNRPHPGDREKGAETNGRQDGPNAATADADHIRRRPD